MKHPARRLHAILKYFTSSISSKIITPYFVLSLVLTAFGIYVVTQLVVVGLEERLKNQLVGAGSVVSEAIVDREELRLEVERVVANTEDVPEAIVARDLQDLYELVSPQILNNQDIDSIVVVDTQQNELLRLQRESDAPNALIKQALGSGVSYSGWPAVARVLANPTGDKEIQLGQDSQSGALIIYTVGPVRVEDGVVGAVLVGTYLRKELQQLSSLALTDIILFDNKARLIDTTLVLPEQDAPAEVFSVFDQARYREVIENREMTLLDEITIPSENKTYRLAYTPFLLRGQEEGVFAVALPTSFVTEQNSANRNWLVVIFSLGIAAVFGVGYLISRRIVRPILQLVSTSQAIARGDLSQRTGLASDDEIGILANSFDTMTAKLQLKTIELEEEASKLAAILTSIADGVLVQDLNGTVISMNPAAQQILKIVEADPAYRQQYNSDSTGPLQEELAQLKFHETQRFEVGRHVLSAIAAPVVTSEGEQLGSVIVLRDITREVEAERLKDDFITSVSHELRTPLTAIKGYNDLLAMTTADKLDSRQKGFIDNIDKNVADLLNLIQEVLDISQIEAGTLGTDQQTIDLKHLVKLETRGWAEKMADKDLAFETHLTAESVWIEGDWGRLSRVIHNLVENAYNYTLPAGRVEVRLTTTETQAEVQVIDTGVGVAQEDQRFLFTRFFRAIREEHGQEIHEVSGAGLGLYMSQAIVAAHGGMMWMESELHQGSKFCFTIPLTTAPPEANQETVEYLEVQPAQQSEP